MMISAQKEVDKNLEDLTQLLLINELCDQNQTNDMLFNYSYLAFNKQKQKPKTLTYQIANYLNPMFMTESKQQTTEEVELKQIKQCMKNSKQSENLQILLTNVLQLPKLRYQQSEKVFMTNQINDTQNLYQNQNAKKLNFQTPQQVKNLSRKNKQLQETQFSSNYPYAQSTAEKITQNKVNTNFQNGKKVLDLNDSSYEEQMDIELNMSARSERSNRQLNSKNADKGSQNTYMMKKRKDPMIFQTQSQKKAKEQKSFIQNYFQSAKNQISEHCSLNCCQGMFGEEKFKQSSKNRTMKQMTLKPDQNYLYGKPNKN